MDPISPDVRELSHRDIQPVETKMDGHHLGPSSRSPQTDVLRCLTPELFVCCNLPHTAPQKNVYQETSNKVPVHKISSFHHFQISFYGVALWQPKKKKILMPSVRSFVTYLVLIKALQSKSVFYSSVYNDQTCLFPSPSLFSLLTWLTGSLKFVIRPARNDVFSSSDNALRTNQSKSCSEEVERSREMKQ